MSSLAFSLDGCQSAWAQVSYDPLRVAATEKSLELTVDDKRRQREIPLRVYLPVSTTAAPIVLFSHGLGGSRDNSKYLGDQFAGRGYVGVFLQHAGSDERLWKEGPLLGRFKALKDAASAENLVLRCEDVQATLDRLELWNKEPTHPLYQRLDTQHVGMCGHSFGAQTTQAVAGQTFGRRGQPYLESRIDAAVAYSPGAPSLGSIQDAFAEVAIPWMLMTGTQDTSPIGRQTVESRQKVYPNLPISIDRYELVLFNAEHLAFSDRGLRGEPQQRNPNHHRLILAFTTAFWDTYLKSDPDAKAWLTGSGAKQLLEPEDRWQFALQGSESK